MIVFTEGAMKPTEMCPSHVAVRTLIGMPDCTKLHRYLQPDRNASESTNAICTRREEERSQIARGLKNFPEISLPPLAKLFRASRALPLSELLRFSGVMDFERYRCSSILLP